MANVNRRQHGDTDRPGKPVLFWELDQSLGLVEQKCRVIKRFVADFLPAQQAIFVHQKCSVQRPLFKIVEAAVGLK